ncbi:MAG: asparagine synthetase B [Sphingobium sp.]|nr:asparagine synthetase B [Sphingobium sp.]
MSAIAGLWRFDGRGHVARDIARMLAALKLYGPHATGDWAEGPIALGRCLFRMLPEDRYDRQPLQTPDSRLTLVADVRLDNREELAVALGQTIGSIGSRCDAALLLDCLVRWGERAVDRLVGDFAFACWDATAQTLLLARDYRGNRPLYFHRGNGMIAVASMAKGLHALPEVPYAPDLETSTDFLVLLSAAETPSFWQGIERVPPGTILSVTRSAIAARRYWEPARPDRAAPPRDYVEGVRHHLDQAVAARLRGAGDAVGAHLSAGWDSAAVAATAARLRAGTGSVVAYTSVPEPEHAPIADRGRFGDEGPLAARTAALYPNIEHVLIRTGRTSPLATLDRDFFLFEQPMLNRCNTPWLLGILEDAKRRGIGVVLTGEMGNMSISYAGQEYLPQLLREGRLIELVRVSHALVRGKSMRWRGLLPRLLLPYLPASIGEAIRQRKWLPDHDRLAHSSIDRALFRELKLDQRARSRGLDLSYRPWDDGFAMRLFVLGRNDPGNYYKGYIGGWGVDQRDPTSDRRLVDYMLAAPMAEYVAGGQFRSLPRRALADRLPAAVLDEPRKGLQAADWHLGFDAARESLREELARIAACAPAGKLIDLDRLTALERDWPTDGWGSDTVSRDYRMALLRGISVGHFLRKASQSNG